MKTKVVSKDVGVGKNGAKSRVVQEYFFAFLRIKLQKRCL
jgi:hypothetical protein